MSSNLLSPQLPVSSMEMGQMEPILKDVDTSIADIQMVEINSVSSNPDSQQLSMSNRQMEMMLEPVPDNSGSQGLSLTYLQMGQLPNENGDLGSQKYLSPGNQLVDMGSLPQNVGSHQMFASAKRKAPLESNPNDSMTHQLSMANKRMAHTEHRPWLQSAPAANRRVIQMESVHSAPGSPHFPAPNKKMVKMDSVESVRNAPVSPHLQAANKKMVKMESFSGRSGSQRSSNQKGQTPRVQPSSKRQNESFESVRSKMRESLAAALALVNQKQDNYVDSGKNSKGESGGIEGKIQEKAQPAADPINPESKEAKELAHVTTSASTLTSISDDKEFQSSNILPYEAVSFSDTLFVKDELLQGNGLSWVLDSEIEMAERKEFQPDLKQELVPEEMGGHPEEQALQSPEELAARIEGELFKLFAGVNKKYKEKGRSLLFNLKDRNNPELRERVMSGEIPPERLCSMTAEELASKELSEWRMAKAEELAQMVVLPDSEVDMRRLVKKTHKGEVEVEQFDSAQVDDPVDATSHTQSEQRSKETEVSTPAKPDNALGEKSTTDEKFTIPSTEATDFMQGLMVDDGLKDLPPIVSLDEFMESLDTEPPFEILPEKVTPISDKDDSETGSDSKSSVLSSKTTADASPQKLDENDTTDSRSGVDLKTGGSDAVIETGSDADIKTDSHAVIKTSDSPATKSRDVSADAKSRDVSADAKSSGGSEKSVSRLPSIPKGERVWGGPLQLNNSPMASVIGIYKSGEKTSAKEWPGFLDIKGRVRLDAFEKFLQELPQSRSRAVMVVHFVPKEGSSETECASLREVAESYVSDERVGFSEPCSGVEIYFCPPHNKTFEMVSKVIQKQHIEALNTIDFGLVGVIVWKKLTSPKSSSHHKHISKKHHYSSTTSTSTATATSSTTTTTTTTATTTSRRQHDRNFDTNFTSKTAQPRAGPPTNIIPPAHDDDDDVPPGFGPGASREDDDLPEFNFSGGSNPSVPYYSAPRPSSRGTSIAPPLFPKSQTPSRPVDQMRELIQKYGQNNTSSYQASGVTVQPWNDDDDDIPEWQPNAPIPPTPSQYQRPAASSYQQPMLRPRSVHPQHQQPLPTLHPSLSVAPNLQNPNSSWQWASPAQGGGMYANNLSCQPEAGQFYGEPDRGTTAAAGQSGIAWRQNAPKSRGF